TEGNDEDQIDLLKITSEDEQRQRKRLELVRQDRDEAAVTAALARVASDAADPNVNLMPALIDAVSVYATLGEIMSTMESEFGRYVEVPVI
ncbi:MAG: methylmalonyl-CoA mutase family protein, partial [Ilumatobacteraceae bacterium]